MDTGLIRVPLTELRSSDEQVVGSVYQKKNKYYRWQKNAGATALVARACCLQMVTSVEAGMNTRVIQPDGVGDGTASVGMPAGMPMSAIGASGTDTGAFGWVQCKGPAKVSLAQKASALTVGSICIGTSALPASAAWAHIAAEDYSIGADETAAVALCGRRVVLMQAVATTGAETAVSALVDIQCL